MTELPAKTIGSVQRLISMTVSIVSPETELKAREYLASVKKELKAFKASITEIKKPFKQEIDSIDAASKPWIEKLQQKDEETERAILAYLRKVKEETEKQNAKLMEKFENKVDKAAARSIETGKPMPLIIPPAMASAPAKTVAIEGAKQTVVKHKKWRVPFGAAGDYAHDLDRLTAEVNDRLKVGIPLEYFVLDTAKVGKVVRAGGTIPGIEVYEEESLAQRAI
jgi:hypothetical protein